MSTGKEIDRSDAFAMDKSGMRFVTWEEAQAILVAQAAKDIERLARRTKRMAEEEASKKKAPGGRRSRPVAEAAKANENPGQPVGPPQRRLCVIWNFRSGRHAHGPAWADK